MAPLAQLKAFTQSVYLIIKGRYFDDLATPDGTLLMQRTVDWTNMFIDELETEITPDGQPIDWKWLRTPGMVLGTASQGSASIPMPSGVNFLLANEGRYVQITHDGTVVSNWAVVAPDQITNKNDRITEDTCSQIGSSVVFSRVFRDYEDTGIITGDVSIPFPRVVATVATDGSLAVANAKILTLVKPGLLLKLGVAKNASLPDIVQGGLSPSYAQKYANLLTNAIARNEEGAVATAMPRDDYSGVSGVF